MAHLTAYRAAQGWGSGSTGTGGCIPFSDWITLLLAPGPRRSNDIYRLSTAANISFSPVVLPLGRDTLTV
jgi:hypothetical protein